MNHSINIAAKRSGLTAHVIRIWEKRYGAVAPHRSDTNRRQYSDEEIERLVLLKQATDAGYKISQIAPLSAESLTELLAKDRETQVTVASATAASDQAATLVTECLKATQTLDQALLESTLTNAALTLGHQGTLQRVVAPLALQIGEQWRDGTITAAHEHFASAIIRVFLTNISKPFAIADNAPRIIVATPTGQLHELGAVIAAATCSSAGWRVTYLGVNLPAAEIAGAARQEKARAVALSLVYPEDDAQLPEELIRLRNFLDEETALIVGGRAAPAYGNSLQAIEAIQCPNLPEFTDLLDRLRSAGPRALAH